MKIAFLQLNAGGYGGIESVNRTLARRFTKNGHEVYFLFLRSLSGTEESVAGCPAFCARPTEPWHFTEGKEIRTELAGKRLLKAAGLYIRRKEEEKKRDRDFRVLQEKLREIAPDRIVTSHYLMLHAVPAEFLGRTFHHVHTSFAATKAQKKNFETLLSFRGRVRTLWLSEASCRKAKEAGFANALFLYNPVSFEGESGGEKRDLVTLTRLSPEKRIPLMVRLVKRALDETGACARLLIYGEGEEKAAIEKEIAGDKRIVLMGKTEDAQKALQNAALFLNTSAFEGFSIGVLEAAACGVPTLSFAFGEACGEEILHKLTGTVVPQDDEEAFVSALCRYLKDPALGAYQSENAAAFARNFSAARVAARWEKTVFSAPELA